MQQGLTCLGLSSCEIYVDENQKIFYFSKKLRLTLAITISYEGGGHELSKIAIFGSKYLFINS